MQDVEINNEEIFPGFPIKSEVVARRFEVAPFREAHPVAGGLLHRLLRVESGNQSFALKVLSRRAARSSEQRAGLERAEIVAERAAQGGIPALVARRGVDGNFLQNVGEEWVILLPWQSGATLPPSAASPEKCALMGGYLGALHALQIRFPDQGAPRPEAFAAGHFAALLTRGERDGAAWTDALRGDLAGVESANSRAMDAQLRLQNGWVTGHLDFDQKNVLWQDDQPTILDWESAKPIHPALELLGAGLSWAGQSAGAANRDSFAAFLQGYQTRNSVSSADLATACEAVLGKWVIWLEFNLRRSLEPEIRGTPEEETCLGALFHALAATLQLQRDVPMFQSWCDS